jgi:hypothetical protein
MCRLLDIVMAIKSSRDRKSNNKPASVPDIADAVSSMMVQPIAADGCVINWQPITADALYVLFLLVYSFRFSWHCLRTKGVAETGQLTL